MRIKYIFTFLILILVIFTIPSYAIEVGRVAKSSSGEGDYKPEYALDGNMKTRWSSEFADNQWWEVDFERPQVICGATLKWETAFGEKYSIEVCDSAGNWKTVYETDEGDGNTDIIYFSPVEIVKFKLNCIERGTGWGFSIWEVIFHNESDMPVITASDLKTSSSAPLAMDGNKKTYWHSDKTDKSQINIKFNKELPLGGIILFWGEDYAREYSVEISRDGENWREVFKTKNSNGGEDQIYFKAADVREIRINCARDSSGRGFSLAEIELKSAEEQVTPLKSYQVLAKDCPEGYYPMWLRRLQEFW
ncbi:MAG: discoidin domain-containing protein, partial [Candidatus Omnitrophica bacterium]|nr:discoidin domain-containing protein [Candidatus Omnitrophota bacterium]